MIRTANRYGQSLQSATTHRRSSTLASRPRRAALLIAACAAMPALMPASAHAADGTWSFGGSGLWSDSTAWMAGTIADGTDAIANFNNVDLPGNSTISLDTARTAGSLTFGDMDAVATPATWTLAAGANTLTLAGAAPTITTNVNTTISGILAGTAGLTKQGSAQLDIAGLTTPSTNLTGGLNIAAGTVRVKGNGTLTSVLPGGNVSGSGTLLIGNASGNTATIDIDLSTFTGTLYSPTASTRWGSSSSAPPSTVTGGGRNATFDLGASGNLFYRNGTNGSITFQIGALAGSGGGTLSGGGTAGTGSIIYQIGNKNI